MIRTLCISSLAISFVLAAIQCLCVMPVQAEDCHAQAAGSNCCCAGNDTSVTDEPVQLPPAVAAASPRIPGADFHAVLQSTGSYGIPASFHRDGIASSPDFACALYPLYVLNASFLI